MIRIIFGGGLGNQLFQYAFLKEIINERNNKNEVIKYYMHRNKWEDKRDFSLNHFDLSLKMSPANSFFDALYYKYYGVKKRILYRICQSKHYDFSAMFNYFFNKGIVYSIDTYSYYKLPKANPNNIVIEGAFQSWKYFDGVKEELINEYRINEEISDNNQKMLNKITTTNSVCVHIRLGDYLKPEYAKSLNVCTLDYYREGMRIIADKVSNPVFYIFSNTSSDIQWIKNNYKFDYPVVYVDLNNNDFNELRLMSSCRHFIIANSTFSWWAQYLSKNEGKIIVAPSVWSKTNTNYSDLYMPEWIIVDV